MISLNSFMFNQLANKEMVASTKAALEKNGMTVLLTENGQEAKQKVLEMLPKDAEVFALSSETLKQTGITAEIDESGNYNSVRKQLNALDRQSQGAQMRKLGAAPDYAVGSVHAITQDGKIFVASNTGSQLPADAYGAGKIIWVVGTQKLVADEEQAKRRIYEYVLPLESARINKVYNITTGSFVSKILIFNREIQKGRITVILVDEVLGF